MKTPLAAISLAQLSDGYTGKVIDQALEVIHKDLADRGHDGLPRTLMLKLTFVPSESGHTEIHTTVETKCPALKPPKTMARYDGKAGGLIFSPDCSENPDQMTFNDLDPSKDK